LYKWLDLDLLQDAKRHTRYPAELRKRIPTGKPRDQVTEAQRRLILLFDFLAIPPDDFQELAIALACIHVVGFGVPKKRGRSPKKRVRPPKKQALQQEPLTTAQIAQKFGASGRGRRIPKITAPALVSSADRWLDEQRNLTGRQMTDADWARSAAREEAKTENMRGWRREDFVRRRFAVKKTQLSQARKKTKKKAAPVKNDP
jgi:hypothetical protein